MLCVEDNRLNALLFESAIGPRKGIELRMAEDGSEALELVSQWTPNVLVLDANLPDIDGFELLRQLRLMTGLAEVPAFMWSADSSEEILRRAEHAGFEGFWSKPIDLGHVMAAIDQLQEAHSKSRTSP